MTHNVLVETLNPTRSLTHSFTHFATAVLIGSLLETFGEPGLTCSNGEIDSLNRNSKSTTVTYALKFVIWNYYRQFKVNL